MGQAYFYHLTRSPLDETLPPLLARCAQAGWRVAIRGRARMMLERLDRALWLTPADGFLPHGLSGGPYDADQPVLLTDGTQMPNQAACLMAVDGAEIAPEEAKALERVCLLFDGHDAAAVDAARAQWRALTGAGVAALYWAQGESGGWEKRAESGV